MTGNIRDMLVALKILRIARASGEPAEIERAKQYAEQVFGASEKEMAECVQSFFDKGRFS